MPGVKGATLCPSDSAPTCTSGPTAVLDYLYLGSSEDASNYGVLMVLRELGITHLLNCAGDVQGTQKSAFSRFGGNTGVLEHVGFDADDTRNYNILQHLPYSAKFINCARERGRKVLVYCVKGINRSAAICAGYMMQEYGLNFEEAVYKVKTKRPGILTNPGFVEQLQRFCTDRTQGKELSP